MKRSVCCVIFATVDAVKVSHRDKQFAALRVDQSADSKRNAAERFRQRHIDNALKRALRLMHDREHPPA